jgi:GNAT superfamily N-acetyltransferase
MRTAVRGLARAGYGARRIALWSSLPPLYHAWAMTSGGERYFLAERGRRVMGYAALRGDEVSAAFVRPSAARQGIGTALLRHVEAEAVRAGARALRVRAALSAVPFYEALGFRGTRRIRVPLPGGETLPARALLKRIGG